VLDYLHGNGEAQEALRAATRGRGRGAARGVRGRGGAAGRGRNTRNDQNNNDDDDDSDGEGPAGGGGRGAARGRGRGTSTRGTRGRGGAADVSRKRRSGDGMSSTCLYTVADKQMMMLEHAHVVDKLSFGLLGLHPRTRADRFIPVQNLRGRHAVSL